MKKLISIMLCIAILLCAFSSVIPSFALSYNNFTYEIVDDSVIITGYTGSETEVAVPSQIEGLNVEKISDNAFKDNKTITSVTVSSGVKDIGASAFENCTSLATISLPDTIIRIGEKAIYNTAYYNNASNWRLKKDPSQIGNGDYIEWEDIDAPVLQYLYLEKILIEIELVGVYRVREGTSVIADGAFKGNNNARQVWLPSSIVAIGENAFEGCESLYTIKDLNKAQYIGDYAFLNCGSLEQIEVAETAIFNASVFYNTGYYNNPNNWRGNVLYYKDKVIGVKENCNVVEIKDGTTEIISGALLNKTVIIPESVVEISDIAFTDKSSATILSYSDSYAKEYADANQIKFIAIDSFEKCDLNFDGVIDDKDYEIICKICSTQNVQNDLMTYLGDLDNDGAVDGFDAIILDLIKNNMPPSRKKGDVNGDGKVDVTDYDLLVSIVTTNDRTTDNIMFMRCDINEDSAVDSFDVICLDLYLKNLMPIV